LFLDLVRRAGETNPELAARALDGLAFYQRAVRPAPARDRPIVARAGGASLRDCGGQGPPIVLVPSLINPPTILDLDPDVSLADALAGSGRVRLVDWGPARDRQDLDLAAHVTDLLLPLLHSLGEPATLAGYCLGGTLALAAAGLVEVRAVVTLAAPWHFSAYSPSSHAALRSLWHDARPGAEPFGVLPIEVLQAAFWSLDPARVVAKFARLAQLATDSAEARRFVRLEDWANGGEPLPLPAARELIEDLFGADLPGRGEWTIAGQRIGQPSAPILHFTANGDGIVPAASASAGEHRSCPAGHVGMIVGRTAPEHLHAPLTEWLARIGPRR
jgi:polyhydroxyalkanoate synthase